MSSPLPVRAPEWIRERKLRLGDLHAVKAVMRENSLHTVCEEARCPNLGECFSRGTATFLLLGDVCTRACGFCTSPTAGRFRRPRGAGARARGRQTMGLRFVVLTSVDRDDLPDGGAGHFAATIRAVRSPRSGARRRSADARLPRAAESLATVVAERPDVFNHNVETVPRLYREVRRGARLERSLGLLSAAKEMDPSLTTKSGFMLGLGEREDEVEDLMAQMREAKVDIVTIGQYLQPSRENLPVVEYVRPEVFDRFRAAGEALGFRHVFAGPFVRSSYRAEEALLAAGNG